MPTRVESPEGTVAMEWTGAELWAEAQLRREIAERLGIDLNREKDWDKPSLQSISLVVAWSFMYAMQPLDESHPSWKEFFPASEWFRSEIISQLNLPTETSWDDIYRLSGFMVEEEYESMEKFLEAELFGENTFLNHPDTKRKLDELELIKYGIVGRH